MNTSPTVRAPVYPVVRCPSCGWKLAEREGRTNGVLCMKCPRCRQVVRIDIKFRRAAPALARRIAGIL